MSFSYLEYNKKLVSDIRQIFEHNIIVENVIYMFHKYDRKVLTDRDIDTIKAFSRNHGAMEGARYLLDYLYKYENWFNCLIKVLRHPDVKQDHIADPMEKIKANLDQDFNTGMPEIQPIEETTLGAASRLSAINPSGHSSTLVTDDPSAALGMPSNTDYLIPTDEQPLYPSTSRNNFASDGCENKDENAPSTSSRVKVISDLPERDFTLDEVADALSSIQGWHSNIEDKQVLSLLKKHIERPGSFILWYWRSKRRPAICVTHDGEIKTLIVHKRPMTSDPSKVDFYFINKDEKTTKNLKELVDHHLTSGVNDLTKKPHKRIIFGYPVLP